MNIAEPIQNIDNELLQGQEKQKEVKKPFSVLDYYPGEFISVSALQMFENCPICFYLRYYCGVKWPARESMELGSKFQEALNLRYAGADYKNVIDSIQGKHRETAELLIKQSSDFDQIISIDQPYIVDFGVGIPVKFIPDLLTKTTVVENKYSSGYYNEEMVKKQKQGTVYYFGVKKLFGFEPEVKYQIFNHKKKKVDVIPVAKTEDDVFDMLTWMSSTLYKIRECFHSGRWQRGEHGPYDCELGKACPIKYKNG